MICLEIVMVLDPAILGSQSGRIYSALATYFGGCKKLLDIDFDVIEGIWDGLTFWTTVASLYQEEIAATLLTAVSEGCCATMKPLVPRGITIMGFFPLPQAPGRFFGAFGAFSLAIVLGAWWW